MQGPFASALHGLTRFSSASGEISLVAVGPLTNIALALRLDDQLGNKLKNFVVMGGNIEGMLIHFTVFFHSVLKLLLNCRIQLDF